MRVPIRKAGKYTFSKVDPTMTEEKLAAFKSKLAHIKTVTLPQAIKDTQRYGENGDFSENAEYQIAKGRLRGLLRQVDELERLINHAVTIAPPSSNSTIQIGHTVTVETAGQQSTFKILGASESNPKAGIISFQSPLGAVLLGHQVGDEVMLKTPSHRVSYTILHIS